VYEAALRGLQASGQSWMGERRVTSRDRRCGSLWRADKTYGQR